METGPRLKVSFDRLVKPGVEPATPGLQGKRFIHYATAAPILQCVIVVFPDHTHFFIYDYLANIKQNGVFKTIFCG